MLEEFDEFVRFCFEHGGTLRNHKAFSEMSRTLREKIVEQENYLTHLIKESYKLHDKHTQAVIQNSSNS